MSLKGTRWISVTGGNKVGWYIAGGRFWRASGSAGVWWVVPIRKKVV